MIELNTDQVRNEAEGKWPMIYARLAPELSDAVRKWGRGVPCPLPGHSASKDGFRFFDRDGGIVGGAVCNTCGTFHDGFALLMHLKGWKFPEAKMEVAAAVGITSASPSSIRMPRAPTLEEIAEKERRAAERQKDDASLKERLNKIWSVESVSLGEEVAAPARSYLRRRRIWDPRWAQLSSLKFHPSLNYMGEGGFQGKWPGIVAKLVGPDGTPQSFHRVFLTPEGDKAPFDDIKKTYTLPSDKSLTGASVHLARSSRVMGVAEGLETAMSVIVATGMPVWACLTANIMETFVPPTGVEEVVIWGDHDRSGRGLEASLTLQGRLWERGLRARVRLPPYNIPEDQKGVDWNDVLRFAGPGGFPAAEMTELQEVG